MSDWHSENGLPGEAVSHPLAAAALERSADLIEPAAEEILNGGEHAAVQGWPRCRKDWHGRVLPFAWRAPPPCFNPRCPPCQPFG